MVVKESVGIARIPVCRINGCDGKVVVKYKTEDITAVAGKDYQGTDKDASLVFEHGERKKDIEIPIHDDEVTITQRTCLLYIG